MAIKKGDKVKVEYKGTLDDGTVFDSSEGREPLEFEIGAGQVISGFEVAVTSMNKGEEKQIKLKPSDAYGDHNPKLIKTLPRSQLPKEPEPKAGMMLVINLQNGKQIPARIAEVRKEDVSIDLNHPLAGKTLNFNVKVVGVSS